MFLLTPWQKGRIGVLLVIFCTLIPITLFSANITVPLLELYTKGVWQDNLFALQTRGEMDLLIEGGYKFGGRVVLGFDSSSLEQSFVNQKTGSVAGFSFQTASIVIREMFSLPLSFTFFVGKGDVFASGESFDLAFGDKDVGADYSGFFYFSDGINYEGIHQPAGTGAKFEIGPIDNFFCLSLYGYQDGYFYNVDAGPPELRNFSPGHYSGDLRLLFNFSIVKLETFLGATGPVPDSVYGYYRGGLLFQVNTSKGLELLLEAGVPLWNPQEDFNPWNFYGLFEAKLLPGIVKFVPSFFLHPKYYLQQPTGEERQLDINLKIHIGTPESLVNGGIEGNCQLDLPNIIDPEVRVSPYFSFVTPGVVWQLKVNAKIYPFVVNEIFEGFVGIKAEF